MVFEESEIFQTRKNIKPEPVEHSDFISGMTCFFRMTTTVYSLVNLHLFTFYCQRCFLDINFISNFSKQYN